ncbi:hypothetical protein CYY_007525 [Polysphondylium violaceum]|uniref:UDP-N-acetylmuramate dehydrogenase n=1 Tax=Polysphondylium violaceum TaxID=133409 RepID=A0A8J4PQU1_9MYCE|nr:hypothetical protein CYY_007525 [Polysphondylium violaceum]
MIENQQQILDIKLYTIQNNIPLLILGSGSNVIIKDNGIRGIVLNVLLYNKITIVNDYNDNSVVSVECGAMIIDVSVFAAKKCLSGIEFACGIPGSMGGAVVMNAGAYGGEIKDILVDCQIITNDGQLKTFSNKDLEFKYRSSLIQDKGFIVTNCTLLLTKGVKQQDIDSKIKDFTSKRESMQPLEYPSCGSVFKRPKGYFTGQLIQDCGLKGKGVGEAQVSTKHSGFIINKSNATATDYIKTIEMVENTVFQQFGVQLEREVKIIGQD